VGGVRVEGDRFMEHFDVLVMGAGLSGVGAGCHLKMQCPDHTFLILEGRARMGGTWDLFRYPGIRSDSDMYTLGYSFRPWPHAKAIADGPAILQYIEDTARDFGVDKHIRYRHRIVRASWSTADTRWTVEALVGEDATPTSFTCNFLIGCGGYYRYEAGYTPVFPGVEQFRGRVVHPQHWTDDIDYANKRVIIIGSGATAVTLLPSLAEKAEHVTMLQRSPTYVVARPAEDAVANRLREKLPAKAAYGLTRWKNVTLNMLFYQYARRRPEETKRLVVGGVKQALGRDYDVRTHFTPNYKPWDQRMCVVPDGDMFKVIRQGKASVVTDHIERITAKGILLKSGTELEADLIITATGLELQVMGGVKLIVDGTPVSFPDKLSYKGMMLSDVPNMVAVTGYTNASWTLKADLTMGYACRLLNHMRAKKYTRCMPRNLDSSVRKEPWLSFTSGYVQRAMDKFPKQGSKHPWRLYQNYALDMLNLRLSRLHDGVMQFDR
jgi:monooxygenase